jgi:glycosyltransferase involved in cell wall biosynthesis
MAPRIGLNLLYLAPGATGGTEVYARALAPHLPAAWPEAEWTVFAGRELAGELREQPWMDRMRVVALPVSSRTRVRRTAAEQTLLPAAIARSGVDLVHSLASTTPLATTATVVVTIHDLIYQRYPDTHAGLLARGMGLLVPAAARRARRIIVSARAAGDDLQHFLSVPAGKIDVVPLGPGVEPVATPTPEPELRERLGLGDGPLVLSVSAHRPHKNLERLIDAMRDVDATLVLPGYATTFDDELRARADGARVVVAGWVSDEDLEGLYRAATCLAFPSLVEGFGLPVLEAMRRGLPVACSGTTALPELAGDAALLFDPESTEEIAVSITGLLDDAALRADFAARGRARAELFSWERTARGVVETYKKALGPR